MEGIYVGKITRSKVDKGSADLLFIDHRQDVSHLDSLIKYDDTAYCLVPTDDIIVNNDELLRLRDEVNQWDDECNEWKKRYAKVNNELFQKGLAYGTLEGAYKNEKITGELLLKDRDALKEKVDELEPELNSLRTENKRLRQLMATSMRDLFEGNGITVDLTQPNGPESLTLKFDIPELNEAKDKIIELEQQVRDERKWCDYWRHTYYAAEKVASVVGVSVKIDGIDGQHNSAKVVVQNDKAEELKKQVVQMEDLKKKLAAAKSNETFWRDRKEEEEDYHHYWFHTFDRAVKQAAEKGIHIGVRGNDDECNAGIVTLDNMKAEDLEKQVVALEKTNENLKQKLGAADNALEYWNNTYNDIVIAGKNVGVKIDIKGRKPDSNAGFVYVTNEKAKDLESQVVQMEDANQKLRKRISAADEEIEKIKDTAFWRNTYYSAVEKAKEEGVTIVIQGMNSDHNVALIKVMNHRTASLERQIKRLEDDNSIKAEAVVAAKDRGDYWLREHDVKSRMYQELEQKHDAKWTAMLDALKDKGVEVIYMGEEDGKPIVDVKIPKLAAIQRKSDARAHRIDILRKDYVVRGQTISDLKKELEELKSKIGTCTLAAGADGRMEFIYTYMDGHNEAVDAESISHDTLPTCKSCAHYMHNPSRFAHDWCYKAVHKEGPKFIRRLSTEEAEGPACSDFKAKE